MDGVRLRTHAVFAQQATIMYFALSPAISFVETDGSFIVLDSRADRYIGLSGAPADELQSIITSRSDEAAGGKAAALLLNTAGIRVAKFDRVSLEQVHTTAPVDHVDPHGSSPKSGLVNTLSTFAAVLARAASLRLRGFHREIAYFDDHFMASPTRPARVDRPTIDWVVARFEQARARLPVARACLLDSLTLRRVLWSHEIHADLLIGVQLHPFTAHAWLQIGSLVINERCEEVQRLLPIRRA